MKILKTFGWIIAFLCGSHFGNAQPQHYQFTHLDVNDGLSHNQVLCFLKDKKGFLWIGTESGLNRFDGYTLKVFRNDYRDSTSLRHNYVSRLFEIPGGGMGVLTTEGFTLYDPEKETFRNDVSAFYKTYHIPPGSLKDVVKDPRGNYWFIHTSAGIVKYDGLAKRSYTLRHVTRDTASLASDSVAAFVQDLGGNSWVIHANGILEKLASHGNESKIVYRNDFLYKQSSGNRLDYRMVADAEGDLWIFVADDNRGVYYFDATQKSFKHFHEHAQEGKLNTNIVRGIAQDNQGLVWVGTDHGGINVIDKKKFSVRYIQHNDEDPKSLAQNSINTLYKDKQGIIWIGTFKKGLSYFHENIIRFPLYRHYASNPRALPFEDVNRFVEDDRGNLWIGTNGGGLIYYDRKSDRFTTFRNNPADPNSLSSDVIVSLLIDHKKRLWIGTYYGGLNCYDGKKFIRYSNRPNDPNSLADRSVWEIYQDSHQRLWIGTLAGGLELMDPEAGTFTHFKRGDLNSVGSNYISVITEDRDGNLWIGTDGGIDVLMRGTGRFMHYGKEQNKADGLSNNSILDIKEDAAGRIWIGTHGGLNLFDKKTKTFKTFTEEDGLPHNSVLTILEHKRDHLWVSTPNGLSNLRVVSDSANVLRLDFRNYDEADGLQGKQFNENAACKTREGELVFGGSNGFNIFKPAQLALNGYIPPVVLSGFELFNQSVKAGEVVQNKVILEKSITEAEEIVLPSSRNVFSIEFAALNFFHPEKNRYQYKLEGFNTEWLHADSRARKVTFTNLDPGNYVFCVKAANNDGLWNEKGTTLKITILPPFWKTRTAFVIYVLLIIGALLLTRHLIQIREKMKYAIEHERREALRMHEMDMMKIKFFTNVSHEFRTPLTLILTPLEKMMKQAREPEQQKQFQLIQRNAKRLLNLVNQLLDFRKLEVQEVKFNPSEGDIIKFIKETVYSFSDLSEKKDIQLGFTTSLNALETIFDQDKLEKILFNLLSNAFKFTPEHGAVTVTVDVTHNDAQKWLVISVADTGIGISLDKQEKIFERFFQNELPRSMMNQGSGIGLSITREFVKIHGGSITVESDPGKGSCFIVKIPVNEVVSHAPIAVPEPMSPSVPSPDMELVLAAQAETKKPVLLLVEDNEDFRFYLKDNLKLEYNIVEAKDGQEGWDRTLANLPDLIVSDVMMPRLNGIDLCRRIKSDQRVSHIPVILLTARTGEEQKLEGFETGADDYINKPFNFEILESRIRNLISQREKFHKAFPRQVGIQVSQLNITSLDEKFIQNAIHCVEENVGNADFSVEDLSRALGISRAHFYKKILSLTGKSPLEFIRAIRLQQAAQLLEKSQLTVAEVAYQVGFNNPKYFARYFKEAYHVLPSAYAAGKRKSG